MNILNEIAEKTRERIERDKKEMPREDLINEIRQKKVQMLLNPLIQSETAKTPHSFYQALKKPGMSYICEVKKASPSKGLIAPDFPYLEIAKEYKAAGYFLPDRAFLFSGFRSVSVGNCIGSRHSGPSKRLRNR